MLESDDPDTLKFDAKGVIFLNTTQEYLRMLPKHEIELYQEDNQTKMIVKIFVEKTT